MDLGKLRGKIQREGYLKKAPQSKGDDKFRKGWKERYFVLKSKCLMYYKKKGDVKHSGKVELADSIVSMADSITKDDFSFRVKQSKQYFLYLKAPSEEEREQWVKGMIESGASFQNEDGTISSRTEALTLEPDESKDAVSETQLSTRICWGAMFKESHDDLYHERIVLVIDPSASILTLVRDGAASKTLKIQLMDNIKHATAVDDRLPNGKQLVPVELEVLRGQKALKKYRFDLGTGRDAKELADTLYNVIQEDISQLFLRLNYPPILWGNIEVRLGDQTGRWNQVWAVLDTGKILLFHNNLSRFPKWVISLERAKFRKEGKHQLEIEASLMDYGIRTKKAKQASDWFKSLQLAQKSYDDRVDEQFQLKPSVPPTEQVPDFAPHQHLILVCGDGKGGQLGLRSKDDVSTPTVIDFLRGKSITDIACSAYSKFSCALSNDGSLYAWGSGPSGELGCGEQRVQTTAPLLVSDLKTSIIAQVVCGGSHVLARTATGELYSWGKGDRGQLGHGLSEAYFYPKLVDSLKSLKVVEIDAGGNHSACIADSSREIYLWGANEKGQLGLGDLEDRNVPCKSPLFKKGPAKIIKLGFDSSIAIIEPSKVYSWGCNQHGKLGIGDTIDRNGPIKIPYFAAKELEIISIGLGRSHGCAVTKEGHVYAWGENGKTGLRKGKDKVQPSRIKVLENVKNVSTGSDHSFFIDGNGFLFAFGANEFGQLGLGKMRQKTQFCQSILVKANKAVPGDGFSLFMVDDVERFVDQSIVSSDFNKERAKEEDEMTEESQLPSVQVKDGVPVVNLERFVFPDASTPIAQNVNAKPNVALAPQSPPVPQRVVASTGPSLEERYHHLEAWREAVDPNTGRAYFYNKVTSVRVWDSDIEQELVDLIRKRLHLARKETVGVIEPAPVASKGWRSAVDPKSGKTYYYNKTTKERRWTNPFGENAELQ